MQDPSGLYSFENRHVTLGPAFARRLRARKGAWAFFEKQPPGYRRLAAFWVMVSVPVPMSVTLDSVVSDIVATSAVTPWLISAVAAVASLASVVYWLVTGLFSSAVLAGLAVGLLWFAHDHEESYWARLAPAAAVSPIV